MKNRRYRKPSHKVGERLKELREEAEMSLKDVSTGCDIPFQNISEIERGLRDPKYSTLEEIIENGLGISAEEFFRYGTIPESLKKKKKQ